MAIRVAPEPWAANRIAGRAEQVPPSCLTIVPALKIGIQTRSLHQPLRRAVEIAAQLGADGVEIDARSELPPEELSQTGIRQFRKLLSDRNLGVSAVSFITRRGYDNSEELERRVVATHNVMKFAQALGANVVINRVGHVPEDENDPRFAALVEVLAGLGAYGDRVGARLAAQTGRESGAQLAQLLAAVPDQTIGVDLHPSGLIHHGHDPAEAVAALGRRVLHVHACDAVRDLARGQAIDVELGRGAADLPSLLGHLEEFNYNGGATRGWVTIECPNSADPVNEAANAVAFLRSL
jgi:sugar phosphate isomerase/epimerase